VVGVVAVVQEPEAVDLEVELGEPQVDRASMALKEHQHT